MIDITPIGRPGGRQSAECRARLVSDDAPFVGLSSAVPGPWAAISGYSLILFVVQALPVIAAVIPLFILFAKIVPVDLEKAAWIDGSPASDRVLTRRRRALLPRLRRARRALNRPR